MEVTDFNLFVSRSRRFGIHFFYIEQVPSQISREVTSSTRLKIAFNTLSEEVVSTARLMGLSRERAEVLRELPVGRCICVLGGERWPHAMLLDIPKYHTNVANLAQAEINKICEQTMADLESNVKPRWQVYEESINASKGAEKDPDALTKNECLVLGFLTAGPNTIPRTREKTGLDTPQETTARSGLMKKGHLKFDGRFANKLKCYSLSAKGEAKAKELGYSVYKYKSGPIHHVVLTETEISLGVAIPGSKFQRKNVSFDNVQPDSLMSFPGKYGTRAAIQIVASTGNYPREAINIKKLAAVNDLEFIVVVSASRKIQIGLEKVLRKEFKGEIPSKVRTLNIGRILEPDWDWVAQFERG